jgi:hypothetical protein
MVLAHALAALLMAVTPAVARPEDCRKCEDKGVVPCGRCLKDPCASTQSFTFCSTAAACPDCGGPSVLPCSKCEAPPVVDLDARRAEIAAWLETVRPVDAFMDKELWHVASPHFTLTWDIPRIDLPRAGKPHPAAHVYLDRLEQLWTDFSARVGAGEDDFLAGTHVMLWSRRADQEKASLKYTLQPSSTESKLMGARPFVSIYYDKSHLHEEFELHQAMVHQTAHCLLSNVFDGIWVGNIRGGWIDEGLAHWYEVHLFGGVRHYCYVESDSIRNFKFGQWEPSVRVAVDRGENLGLLAVTGRNTVEMTPEQRMYSWSFCDYLLRARPGTFGPVARALKQKKSLKDALKESVDATAFELERDWVTWVKATYSPKKRKR